MSSDAPTSDTDFSGMGIYVDGRVKNELDEMLVTKKATELTARDVHLMSSMHYLDDEPMLRAAEFFNLVRRDEGAGEGGGGGAEREGGDAAQISHSMLHSRILDFGSGFAGDARCFASEYQNTHVTCVEVQKHIHDAAQAFTEMLNFSDVCTHQCVDVFVENADSENKKIAGAPFDALYSILVILHVPRRDALFGILAANLKPGGLVYIEDYFLVNPLIDMDKKQLQTVVACPYLPSKDEYEQTLRKSGFENIEWETMTDAWVPFIDRRLTEFRSQEGTRRNERVHGAALTKDLDTFYSTVHELFTRGNVGGVRIRARKKSD
ncbi:methyltransferase domain-containing protein [bacterium]|nr:methyltransferase domain-containing protein [bacterium]|tara:strand:+ start:9497 stop:10462 length:966 start_codon:yes stop_codon:yes gene_type:complete